MRGAFEYIVWDGFYCKKNGTEYFVFFLKELGKTDGTMMMYAIKNIKYTNFQVIVWKLQ